MRHIFLVFCLVSVALSSTAIKFNFQQFLAQAVQSQKLQGSASQCKSFLENLYFNPGSEIEAIIYTYSAHNIQDLGDYQTCNNISDIFNLTYISGNVTLDGALTLYFGICGPSVCTADDYSTLIAPYVNSSLIPPPLQGGVFGFADPTTFTPEESVGLIVAVAVIVFVITINLAGTTFTISFKYLDERRERRRKLREEKERSTSNPQPLTLNDSLVTSLISNDKPSDIKSAPSKEKGLFRKISECFDIDQNFSEMMNDDRNPQHDDNLRVFNGIRVLAFCWVVFGHVGTFSAQYAKNLIGETEFYNSVWLLTLYAGFFAVDLFYFMSGFFAGYILIQKSKSMGPGVFNYFKIFVHRFLRIWPSYVVCILFFWQILPWLGSGPLWNNQLEFSASCDGNWWKNFLFIDNLFGTYSELCYGWGWYLSTDFQIFLVVPIVVWIYHYDKETGRGVLWILISLSIIIGFYEAINTNYPYTIPFDFSGPVWDYYYINPLVRASPYLIGTFFGIMYKRYKTGEEENFYNNLERSGLLSLVVSVTGLALSLFIVYYPRVLQNGGTPWPTGFAYTWMALERPVYVTAMFMFIAPCLGGNFSWLREVLGVGAFSLLSKLTFTMYLVHYQVLEWTYFTDSNMVDLTGETMYYRTLAVVLITAVISVFVHVLVEKPFGNLEVRVLNPKKVQRSDSEFAEEKLRVKQEIQDMK